MPLTVKTGAMKVKDPSSGNYVDVDMSLGVDYAPINSPEFVGTPKAPTATSETNNTQIATTAFVQGLVSTEAGARQAADSALQGSLTRNVFVVKGTLISGRTTSGNIFNQTTASDSRITTNTEVANIEFDNPTYITSGNVTVIPGNGTVTVTGQTSNFSDTVNVTIELYNT